MSECMCRAHDGEEQKEKQRSERKTKLTIKIKTLEQEKKVKRTRAIEANALATNDKNPNLQTAKLKIDRCYSSRTYFHSAFIRNRHKC